MANRWSRQRSTGAAHPPKPWSPARTGPSNQRDDGGDGREALSAGQQALKIARVWALLNRAAEQFAGEKPNEQGYLALAQLDAQRHERAVARHEGEPGKRKFRAQRAWLSRTVNQLNSPTGKLSLRLRLYQRGGEQVDNVSFTVHTTPTPERAPAPPPVPPLSAEWTALEEANQVLAERVAKQEAALTQAMQTIAALQGTVTGFRETVAGLRETAADLQVTVQALDVKHDGYFDDVINKLRELERRLE